MSILYWANAANAGNADIITILDTWYNNNKGVVLGLYSSSLNLAKKLLLLLFQLIMVVLI